MLQNAIPKIQEQGHPMCMCVYIQNILVERSQMCVFIPDAVYNLNTPRFGGGIDRYRWEGGLDGNNVSTSGGLSALCIYSRIKILISTPPPSQLALK